MELILTLIATFENILLKCIPSFFHYVSEQDIKKYLKHTQVQYNTNSLVRTVGHHFRERQTSIILYKTLRKV